MLSFDIDGKRIMDFIESFYAEDKDISFVKEYALHNDVPIIRDETRDFIDFIMRVKKPHKILELGTAIAYSTMIMYKALEGNLESIVTIENDKPRILEARKNIDTNLDKDKVVLIEDDITNYLDSIEDSEVYDFIFLDAAKAQYVVWLPKLKKLMKKGAILLSDNIFKDGEVLESRYTIIKRDRTIHKRMREFLHKITHDDDLYTRILNIGDGISLTIKK